MRSWGGIVPPCCMVMQITPRIISVMVRERNFFITLSPSYFDSCPSVYLVKLSWPVQLFLVLDVVQAIGWSGGRVLGGLLGPISFFL